MTSLAARSQSLQALDEMVRYYSESGPDYEAWSPGFNMHFGYWQPGIHPFDREGMLERMNQVVTISLASCRNILDMGCGVGATARSLAGRNPRSHITGITIVPWQVERAREMAEPRARLTFLEEDYTQTRFANGEFDGAYAIESFCHAAGRNKATCITEAARILRPGGKLVIADGFLRKARPLPSCLNLCHQHICRCWSMDSLPILPEVVECLEESGFRITGIEDASWRVAVSVAHVPFVTARFLLRELLVRRSRLSRERWNNILAPLLTGVVGLARAFFGYYIIRAVKRS